METPAPEVVSSEEILEIDYELNVQNASDAVLATELNVDQARATIVESRLVLKNLRELVTKFGKDSDKFDAAAKSESLKLDISKLDDAKASVRYAKVTLTFATRELGLQNTKLRRAAKQTAKANKRLELKALKEASRMPEQNGIRRPNVGTKTAAVWAICDQISGELRCPAPRDRVITACTLTHNSHTIITQYARWRKYNGVVGRVIAPMTAEEITEQQAATKRTNALLPTADELQEFATSNDTTPVEPPSNDLPPIVQPPTIYPPS